MKQIERHPLPPYIPNDSKVLMLGAFPPKREKWSMDFFYPNFINDMWRIMGIILHDDKDYFVDVINKKFDLDKIKLVLNTIGVAVSDVATEVCRLKDNASDKYLEIVSSIDIYKMLEMMPSCQTIITTGEKAGSVVSSLTNTSIPKIGKYTEISVDNSRIIRHYRLPSTSRAYPMKIEEKAKYYRLAFQEIGII